MEFRDLKQQYQQHKASIDTAIYNVIADAHYIGGKEVNKLEMVLADYVGITNCITCANGTDALQLALMAWNIGPGDAVFVPDFTFFSSGEVVSCLGATPVFVDIDMHTFNIDSIDLQNAIKATISNGQLTPKAIIAVDLFGLPADYSKIKFIAEKYNLLILEDSAQGFGGELNGQKACSFGDISTTSFFPAKPLGCYGDGGAIFTSNDEWASIIKSLKVHGKGDDKYDNIRIGMNSRLDTVQAAILLEKLSFFTDEIVKCNEVATLYNSAFKDVTDIIVPTIDSNFYSSWAQYTILLKDSNTRERVMSALKSNDIPSMIYYKKPMHLQKAFSDCQIVYRECPITSNVSSRCLSLPMSAYVSPEDINNIVRIITDAL